MAHGTPSVVVQASSGFGGNTATTSSFTPSTGDLLLAAGFQACNASGSGAAGKPTITDSLGKTWTEIASVLDPLSDNHLALWSHLVTEGSPASRTVTTTEVGGTGGAPHAASLVVFKSNGAQVRLVSGSPNKGIASVGSGGDPSGTMDNATLSTSTLVSVAVNLSNADFTPNAGTDFLDYDSTGNPRWGAAYRTGSTSTSFGFTSTGSIAVAVAVEIEDAVTAASGTGSSDATASASAVGHASSKGVASSTAATTASAVGRSTASAVGGSTAAATGSAIGRAKASASASSAAQASVSAVGNASARGVASSVATALAEAVGQAAVTALAASTALVVASAIGHSSVSAVASSTAQALASAIGNGSFSAVAFAEAESDASATGRASASGVGSSAAETNAIAQGEAAASSIGAAAAESDADATGHSSASAVANAAAVATAQAYFSGATSGDAEAAAQSDAQAVGHASAQGVAASSSEAAAQAVGHSAASGVAASSAAGVAQATGHSAVSAVANAAATSDAEAQSSGGASGVAEAAATLTASGIGHSSTSAIGNSVASANASGVGHSEGGEEEEDDELIGRAKAALGSSGLKPVPRPSIQNWPHRTTAWLEDLRRYIQALNSQTIVSPGPGGGGVSGSPFRWSYLEGKLVHQTTSSLAIPANRVNNLQALQAILDDLGERGGGTLWLNHPKGLRLFVDGRLDVPSRVHLITDQPMILAAGGTFTIRIINRSGWALADQLQNGRIRTTANSGQNLLALDSNEGSDPDLYIPGMLIQIDGLGGEAVTPEEDNDEYCWITDVIDNGGGLYSLELESNLQLTYEPIWDPDIYPEAAEYEALYGIPDRTYIKRMTAARLTADAGEGSASVVISSVLTSLFSVGNIVFVGDETFTSKLPGPTVSRNRKNVEIRKIVAINGGTGEITFDSFISRAVTTANKGYIQAIDPAFDTVVEGFHILPFVEDEPGDGRRRHVFESAWCAYGGFRNCVVDLGNNPVGPKGSLFRSFYSFCDFFDNCKAILPYDTGSGEGYGLDLKYSTGTWVSRHTTIGGRHGCVIQTATQVLIETIECFGTRGAAVDFHGLNSRKCAVGHARVFGGTQLATGFSSRAGGVFGNTTHVEGDQDCYIDLLEVYDFAGTDDIGVRFEQNCKRCGIGTMRCNNVTQPVHINHQSGNASMTIEDCFINSLEFRNISSSKRPVDCDMSNESGRALKRFTLGRVVGHDMAHGLRFRQCEDIIINEAWLHGDGTNNRYAIECDDVDGFQHLGGNTRGFDHAWRFEDTTSIGVHLVGITEPASDEIVRDGGGNAGTVQKLSVIGTTPTTLVEGSPSGSLTVDYT